MPIILVLLIMEAGVASRNFVADMNELCPALANAEPGKLFFDELPRAVLFFDEAELPMTGSNKIRRPELRKMVVDRLAVEA